MLVSQCSAGRREQASWLQAVQSSSCQPWMLGWGYRKQNLLKELLGYHADILCLQEVCCTCQTLTPAEQ